MPTETTTSVAVISRYADIQQQIAAKSAQCANFVVNSPETLNDAKKLAKEAAAIVKLIDERRTELVAPHLTAQREINAYAKEITEGLDSALKGFRAQILSFEQEQERKRQAELKRLDDERREKELAEQRERERISELKTRLNTLEAFNLKWLHTAKEPQDFTSIIERIEAIVPSEFEEFAAEAESLKERLINSTTERWAVVKAQLAQEEEAKKLDGEAKRQAEERIALEKQAEELRQREERIAADKAEQEREEKARAEQAEIDKQREADEAARIAEQAALSQKSGSISKRWVFRVEDKTKVPISLLTVDEKAVKEAIKQGTRSIPGIVIYQEEGLVLR